MSSPAITIPKTSRLPDAARLLQERNVRRLVVVDERGKIAGILSRSDMLQVFLRSDEDLREEVLERLIPSLMLEPGQPITVEVCYNVVTLDGDVDRKSDVEILGRLTRNLDGVVGVINKLRYRWDDTELAAVPGW